MPFIRNTVSKEITKDEARALKEALGKSISLVSGKSECYLMLSIEGGVTMAYQGDMDTPAAMVEVQLLGAADEKELDNLTAAITEAYERILGIDGARVYVNYLEYTHWGVLGHNV